MACMYPSNEDGGIDFSGVRFSTGQFERHTTVKVKT